MTTAKAHSRRSAGTSAASKVSPRMLLIAGVAAAIVCVAAYIPFAGGLFPENAAAATKLSDIPFNGAQAYEYLKQLCEFGPRASGSTGMAAQQKFLIDYFQKAGAKVIKQDFTVRHPLTGDAVPMTNLIIEWHPERKERVLLCAHYDTRPFPDRDRRNPAGKFIGANDGASGVALLMELAHSMPKFQSKYGVDFLLVDGEDLVYWNQNTERDTGKYCLGSDYFGRMYAAEPPPHTYKAAVVFDMIASTSIRLPKELNTVSWPDSKWIANDIWATAAKLKVKEFANYNTLYQITDDHVMLHDVGKIPACDLINMDYPYWHTEADTPDKCSPLSLAKVGWVIEEWLKSLK